MFESQILGGILAKKRGIKKTGKGKFISKLYSNSKWMLSYYDVIIFIIQTMGE